MIGYDHNGATKAIEGFPKKVYKRNRSKKKRECASRLGRPASLQARRQPLLVDSSLMISRSVNELALVLHSRRLLPFDHDSNSTALPSVLRLRLEPPRQQLA